MIPAMVAVMLVHRGEYSLPVHQHALASDVARYALEPVG